MKLFTAVCLAVCLGLMATWVLIAGHAPERGSSKRVYLEYQRRSQWFLGGVAVTFVGACVGASLVMRQARREFRERSQENLRHLIEGAQEDLRAKRGDVDSV